jgi:hypothetical protein
LGLLELAAGGAAAAGLNLNVDPCPKSATDEIVVCGNRDSRSSYRLPRISHKYDARRLNPEKIVPGGRIHAESRVRPDGLVDKRIMITFAIPF